MDTAIVLALAAALGALLAYTAFDAWRRVEPLPFFQVLGRHGLSVAQAEEAAGPEAFAAALQRCAQCSDRKGCARALVLDRFGRWPLACGPNAKFFELVKDAEAQRA